jgi:hypothetical protein
MSRDARLSDRIKQLSFDPSTNAFALDSIATGFSPFSDFYEEGDVVFYAATDGTRYEMGSGEYTSNTITRYPLRSNQISSGPYYLDAPSARETDAGVTGVWHPLYLTKSAASGMRGYNVAGGAVSPASGVHEHTFSGYPGVTFYMPNMETAGHANASSVTKSGENYATSGAPVSFQGVTEVFVSYPGKYSVFSAGGISGFNEPKSKGVAFWGNEQTLDYDSDIVWDTGVNALGVSQPSPVHPIDVGGLTSYSQVRASGFIGGGSGVAFSGGQALPQSSLKTASGGRQLEPFFRNELDNQTKSDQMFSLSGLVDERLLLQQQIKGAVFAGPASGCTATCSPDYPEFRYLESEDLPDLSSLYVVQQNYFDATDIPAGAVAFTNASGKVEFNKELVFAKATNRLGINTTSPEVALSVNGDIRASGDVGVSGNVEVNNNLTVGGNIVVSGSLDVQGDVTYIDSTQVMVVDKQLELASMSGAALHNHGALDSGGIILKSTDGDQFWIYSSGSLDGSAYDPAWVTDADIWTSGGAIRFNDGPSISGGYHAGSGLELHNGVAFNVGNLFQVSGNDGTNGFIHQGSILTVSGISGVSTTFTQLDNSGVVTIDPTDMYNALSGAIIQVDGADNNWKIHVTSGSYPDQSERFPQGHVLDTIDVALAVSGVSGISLNYDAANNGLFISAEPVSGYFESRIGGLGGGYGSWNVHASGGNPLHWYENSGMLLDGITAAQTVTFSGIRGVDVGYIADENALFFDGSSLSGNLTELIITSGDKVLEIASGLATVASGHAIDVSGYVDGRIAGLAGGYLNWKVNASGHNSTQGEAGQVLDSITTGQALSVSGVSGVDVDYTITDNFMSFSAAPISGYFNSLLGEGVTASGATEFIIASGNRAQEIASGLAITSLTFGSGVVRQDGVVDLRHDGSGTLKHLSFSHGVRIGEGAGVGISGLDSLSASGTGVPIPDSGIATGAIFIGSHAGSGSINLFPVSGIFIGHEAGALSSGNQDSIFIGRSAGLSADSLRGSGNHAGSGGQMYDNIGIGRNAAGALLNSDNSTFIGLEAGYKASGNQSTVAVGQFAASGLEKSEDSVFIGTNAGSMSSGILRSNFIGRDAGGSTAISGVGDVQIASGLSNFDQSNMIGYRAGAGAVAFSGMIEDGVNFSGIIGSSGVNFIGSNAGADSLYCDATDFIGSFAGYKASGLITTVGLGNRAYEEAFGSHSGVAVGAEASSWSSGELFVNAIGVKAGLSSSGNSYCNFIGFGAGAESGPASGETAGNLSINAMGRLAFYRGSGCRYSDFIGYAAGQSAVNVDSSFVAGLQAGMHGEDFDSCVIIGDAAAASRSGIHNSVILGDQAGGKLNTTGKGDPSGINLQKFADSILIGRKAGYGASGLENIVAIGTQAASNAGATGIPYEYGIFIGHQAGYSQDISTTRMPGDKNLIISTNAQQDEASKWADDNQSHILSIGYLMHGYTEHSQSYSNRHLQIGAAPSNLTELQEATLTVRPDSFGHIGVKLRQSAIGNQSAALLEAEMPSAISSANNVVINKEGLAQILVATYSPSAGEYQTASGMTSNIGKYPGAVIVFDDAASSTKELLICLSDGSGGGTWYKLDDDLVTA